MYYDVCPLKVCFDRNYIQHETVCKRPFVNEHQVFFFLKSRKALKKGLSSRILLQLLYIFYQILSVETIVFFSCFFSNGVTDEFKAQIPRLLNILHQTIFRRVTDTICWLISFFKFQHLFFWFKIFQKLKYFGSNFFFQNLNKGAFYFSVETLKQLRKKCGLRQNTQCHQVTRRKYNLIFYCVKFFISLNFAKNQMRKCLNIDKLWKWLSDIDRVFLREKKKTPSKSLIKWTLISVFLTL